MTVLLVLSLVLLSGCASDAANKADHCYLCEGLPYDGPCLVDLSTGNVVEITPGTDTGYVSFLCSEDVVIRTLAGEYSETTIPIKNKEVNPHYFCESCLKRIAAVSNGGYVLADVHDLNDVQLYKIEAGTDCKVGNVSVAVTESEADNQILVRAMPAKADE